jgi:DNA (cytosine-5)-methyltransferase 1
MGYHRAGFDEIVGVDIVPQPDYPFEFVQASVHAAATIWPLTDFDLIHASPPCQAHSALTKGTNRGRRYPDLIGFTRKAFNGRPLIIENVAGAPIRKDLMLCGEMFGLGVIRHRYFEYNGIEAPYAPHPKHRGRVRGMRHGQYFDGPYLAVYGSGGYKGTVAEWQQAMGIDWTDNRKSIAEAIPPAYTEYIGRVFLNARTPHREG